MPYRLLPLLPLPEFFTCLYVRVYHFSRKCSAIYADQICLPRRRLETTYEGNMGLFLVDYY